MMHADVSASAATAVPPVTTEPESVGAAAGMAKSGADALAESVTLERLLYAVIVATGAFLRFFGLARMPLSPAEATNAWSAWLSASALAVEGAPVPTSALLHALQTATFWLAGAGDAAARFWPAVAGLALVLLPWWLRDLLGRRTALALALLLALDPWLVVFSRQADGAMLAIWWAMLVLVMLARATQGNRDAQHHRYLKVAAAALGLLLVSGVHAWSLLPVVALYAGLTLMPHRPALRPEWRQLGLIGAAAALLGATGWLSMPGGLGTVAESFGLWLTHWQGPDADAYPAIWLILRLLGIQTFVLGFGLAGLVRLWRKDEQKRLPLFLTIWAVWGLLLLALPGRTPADLTVLTLPLLVAAAYFCGTVLLHVPAELDWRAALILLATLVVLTIPVLFWMAALLAGQFDLTLLVTVVLVLVTGALLVLIFGLWSDWAAAGWLTMNFLAGALLLSLLSSAWQINHAYATPYANGLTRLISHPEVRLLVDDIATISAQRIGDPGEIPLQVQMDAAPDPLLGWYLRDMRRLQWVLAPAVGDPIRAQNGGRAPLIITRTGAESGVLMEQGYVGSDYAVRERWLPAGRPGTTVTPPEIGEEMSGWARLDAHVRARWDARVAPGLRWMFYRIPPVTPVDETVVLWATLE